MRDILFIIPHPDDEIVGCCSIIKNFLEENKKIHLFFLTNGVLSEEFMWFWQKSKNKEMMERRKEEMNKSMEMLGITSYTCQDIPTRTLKMKISETFYKIKEFIYSKKIDTIFCPAYEGGHQDHDISNFICSKLSRLCIIKEFSEYNFFNRKINCNSFIKSSKGQKVLRLSNKEKTFKTACLKIYETERSNLDYIEVKNESYRPIAKYDYSRPPHDGVVFYRRYGFFSWHPKVSSETPKEISKIIINSEIFKLK